MTKGLIITTHNNYLIAAQCRKVYNKIVSRRGYFEVKRSRYDNVANEVNIGLREFDILRDYKNITIDVLAELHVISDPKAKPFPIAKEVSMEQLYSYPFENFLGLILPMELNYEDDSKLIYQTNIIDPVEDYRQFLSNLQNHKQIF